MPQTVRVALDAAGVRVAIVASRFNDFITTRLIDAALAELARHGGDPDKVTLAWVPGAFELPLVAQRLAKSGKYDAVLCLGCVIRGQTPHFDHVAGNAARGIGQVSLETGVPVIFGVLTTDTVEQAIDRAGGKHGNKGADAALAGIEMARLLKAIGG
ncbi:MAG: 6,7-dimethyl-8-ribityllumazine synthase [Planctomycetia bacterium]|nr:MAG: 6,7-dimethyl-8-ribityllumazine synthase [Planctomycetia bacterium]